jgi:uncharacterized membrane protein
VLAFSDGLFAIAMTLLVVGIGLPRPPARGEMSRPVLPPLGPVAFLDTTVAVAVWFLTIPGELLVNRVRPPGTDEWF